MSYGRSVVRWAVLLLLFSLVAGAGAAAAPGLSLELRADPDRLPADGTSQAVIVAEVTGPSGAPAPDGTVVRFVTSLGSIVSPVQTLGGLAQTSLTSSRTAGTAVVSAIAGSTRRMIEIPFSAMPGSRAPGTRLIELRADDLAYSGDLCLFVATDNATLEMGRVSLRADGLQYEVSNDTVRAQGRVVLKSGDKEVQADALRYDLLTLRGRLIRLTGDGGGERLIVEGDRLTTKPDDSKEEALWTPLKTGETRAWVKSRRALVDPGHRIVLDHATFYVDDMKVLSLPRHVLGTRPTSALLGQVVGFNSVSGVTVDYPYYFAAGANSIGALHFRRNAALGSAWSPGWLLGISEDYTNHGSREGSFSLDSILHPSEGVHWRHQERFAGGLSVEGDFDSISTEGNQPSYRTAGLNASHPLGEGSLSLTLGKSTYGGSTEQSADLGYRFSSFSLGGGIVGTPGLHLRQSESEITMHDILVDPVTGEPLMFNASTGGRTTSASADLAVNFHERNLGALKLTGTMTTGYSWLLSGGMGAAQFATRWTLDRRFSKNGYVGLALHYSITPPAAQTGLLATGNQRSLTLSARGPVKEGYAMMQLTQGLEDGRRYGCLNLHQPLPFGKDALNQPRWTFDAYHMFSQFGAFQAQNTVLSLNRTVGRYQASLKYSPEGGGNYGSNQPWISPWGFGYTYSGGKHLWLEFSAATQ